MSSVEADGAAAYGLETAGCGWRVGRFTHLSALPGLVHAVTTRDAIDVRIAKEDRPRAAALVAEALGLEAVAFCKQVHGPVIYRVDRGGLAGEGDGLLTDKPGLGLLCFSADCPLIMVADTSGPAVGIVHASWRSTVQSIATRLIERMAGELGCQARNLVAAIAPSAGPCCYEVGPEVVEAAVASLGLMAERYFRASGRKFMFDLWGLNRRQLMDAGVPGENIKAAGVCTICSSGTYPSYRAEGEAAGRFVAVIARAAPAMPEMP